MTNKTKTILVTGGAGFIGTNFIRLVLAQRPGWNIINLDALTYAGNPMNFTDIPQQLAERYQFVHGDIRDKSLLDRLFNENKLDGLVHFAAESHVDRSILGPEAFVEANVLGTFRLLEAALQIGGAPAGRTISDFFIFQQMRFTEASGRRGFFQKPRPMTPPVRIRLQKHLPIIL